MNQFQRFFHHFRRFFRHFFKKPQKPFIYVAMGDSTVEGIGASHPDRSYTGIISLSLKDFKKEVEYHNLGKAGATIEQMVNEQLERAIALDPDLITISIGANDVKARTAVKDFENHLQYLLERLKKETVAEIVMNNIPDLSLTPKVPRSLKQITRVLAGRLNTKIAEHAKEFDIILVDIYQQSRIYAKNYPEALSDDGFHPSDFGYAIWANTVLTHIQHLIKAEV